jgi:hypothetical protein
MSASNGSTQRPSVTGNGSLLRPRFSAGLLLQDDDLTQIVDYTRGLMGLFLRSVFGCGVLCGLDVTPTKTAASLRVEVGDGVALTCGGELIEVRGAEALVLDTCGMTTYPQTFWVVLHGAQMSCAPRETMCSPQGDDLACAYTRIREGFKLELVNTLPADACNCASEAPKAQNDAAVNGSNSNAASDTTSNSQLAVTSQTPPTSSTPGGTPTNKESPASWLLDPTGKACYDRHFQGKCDCTCGCDAVLIAKVVVTGDQTAAADYSERRYVRVALLRDRKLG